MPGSPPRVAIGLCDGLDGPGRSDLAGLRERVEDLVPDAVVEVVSNLCRRPELLPGLAERTAAERLVVGLCAPEAATSEFQSWTRKAGLDPYGVELVALPLSADGAHSTGAEEAAVRLAAATARLQAFRGSEPEQLKLQLLSQQGRVSRRALFTIPPVTYEAVPSVDRERCLGERRCGLCVSACPVTAIETREGEVVVDKARCESCGICVTTCPAGAVGYPGSSLPQYEAEVGVLAGKGRGIVFTCRRSGGAPPPGGGWLPVGVPCLGMVTPGWILQSLAAGAPAVALASCGERCRFAPENLVRDRVDYVWLLLSLLGEASPSRRVRTLDSAAALPAPADLPSLGDTGRRPTLMEPAATAEAVLRLAERYGAARDLFLAAAGSPLGVVTLKEETCTVCGACADVCPTGALALERDAEASSLSYDPARCTGCERCVPVCPEGASETIRARHATDLQALRRGRVTLKHGELVRCRRCGSPIAAAPMLRRVRDVLAADGESEGLLHLLGELCPDCRGLA